MHTGLIIAIQLALLAVVVWGVGYLWETHLNNRPGRVLYHGSNLREQGPVLLDIVKRYLGGSTGEYTLVEPGAGMATVARYLARRLPWRAVEAVEIGLFIIALGRLRFLLSPSKVRIIRKDLFAYAIPAPSVVYCYLFPSIITRLYEEGALEGKLVISLTFQIKNCQPTERVSLASWQSALYVYDFREG